MAHRILDSDKDLIGKVVYEPFKPQHPGVITEELGMRKCVKNPNISRRWCRVLWLKRGGFEEECQTERLCSLDELIKEQKGKLAGHEKRRKQIKKLAEKRKE